MFFSNFEIAEKWLLKNGKKFTDECDCPVMFEIIKQNIESESLIDNLNIPYTKNKYVFSSESYKMMCSEIFIFITSEEYCVSPDDFKFKYIDGTGKEITILPKELPKIIDEYFLHKPNYSIIEKNLKKILL